MNQDHTPLVSILIPCYNASRWVGDAIRSALAQTWPNKEVIVFDDGSTDNSLEVIRSFRDAIRFEYGPNRGGNVARNRLLMLARGEWLQYLDADDYLLKGKIAGQLASVPDRLVADVIYSPMTVEFWHDGLAGQRETLPVPELRDPWILLSRWQMPGTHAVLWRRSSIIHAGLWNPTQPCCQEHELYMRLLIGKRKFVYTPHGGAIYRKWSNETVSTRNPMSTIVNRLKILDRIADYLRGSQQWTPERSRAVAHARLESARSLYRLDRSAAYETADTALRESPAFKIPASPSFPWSYRAFYRLLGFRVAEKSADATRRMRLGVRHTLGIIRRPLNLLSPEAADSIDRRGAAVLDDSCELDCAAVEKHTVQVATPCAKVSILIPCYNAKRWIAQAIRSALEQTWSNKEVIVVDDGSTDGSLEIIRSFGDAIWLDSGPHRGGNIARNRLLEFATGEWLQYLDADDYLMPEKIERQLVELRNPGAVDVAYSPVILEFWEESHLSRHEKQEMSTVGGPWEQLVLWHLPQTGASLWRRSAIIGVGGWKPDQPCCQEHELYFRLLASGNRFQFCPTAGAVYRQWSANTVCRKDPLKTLSNRLAIIDAAEKYLLHAEQLHDLRRDAIATARIQCARSLYQINPAAAIRTAALVTNGYPTHKLNLSSRFPRSYRWLYNLAGFEIAEMVARFARPWRAGRPV